MPKPSKLLTWVSYCPYPVRLSQPTARLVTSIVQLSRFPSSGFPSVRCYLRVSGCPSHGEQFPCYAILVWGSVSMALSDNVWLDLGYLVSHFWIRHFFFLSKCIIRAMMEQGHFDRGWTRPPFYLFCLSGGMT